MCVVRYKDYESKCQVNRYVYESRGNMFYSIASPSFLVLRLRRRHIQEDCPQTVVAVLYGVLVGRQDWAGSLPQAPGYLFGALIQSIQVALCDREQSCSHTHLHPECIDALVVVEWNPRLNSKR
jgi:hypothetical protein